MSLRRVIVEVVAVRGRAHENLGPVGAFESDRSFLPVPVPDNPNSPVAGNEETSIIRGQVEYGRERDLARIQGFVKWYDDHLIEPPFETDEDGPIDIVAAGGDVGPCGACDCNGSPEGSHGDLHEDVVKYLGVDYLWERGIRGEGMVIGICDVGVRKSEIPGVIDGWSHSESSPWGDDHADAHGTMCATDALGICPQAHVYDIGILKQYSGGSSALLSDAVAGFHWALTRYRRDGTPQVLSNSWAFYRSNQAEDYVRDANHVFTRKVVELIDSGIAVFFAAGNCGESCPFGRCGDASNVGSGKSIWGANGHERVITVGAANIIGQWIGYSSQGPAALARAKPDLCAPSHFKGFFKNDVGTSAACPVCAGVGTLVRQAKPSLSPSDLQTALCATSKPLCDSYRESHPDWDYNFCTGHGMVDARSAYLDIAR